MKRASFILLSVGLLAAIAMFMGCSDQSSSVTAPVATLDGGAGPNNVYTWLIGSGLLCQEDTSNCPDMSQAPDGDQFVLTGEGTVSISPPTITGGGTYQILDAAGNVTASGTWEGGKLYGFVTYGQIGSSGSQYGGRMQASIDLTGQSGEIILNMTRADGDHVPQGVMTGAAIKYHGEQFNNPTHGSTVFILQ